MEQSTLNSAAAGTHEPHERHPAMPLVERIARILSGEQWSANADGTERSAAQHVDEDWPRHLDKALAVLRAFRDLDHHVASANDTATWSSMIEKAIAQGEQLVRGGPPST